jgi:DNA-directed RNA polymerase sigma subunit (sigma70/sigma32)
MTEAEVATCFDELWSARNRLIEDNMHWVRRFAEKTSNDHGIPLDHLLELGKKALIKAINAYHDHKHQFAPNDELVGGYAIWWVRAEFARLYHLGGQSPSGE